MLSEIQKAHFARMFDAYDANHDGFLTLEDFTDHARKLATARGEAEGRALVDNITETWANLARGADTDHDGRVSRDEFVAFTAVMVGMLQDAVDKSTEWPLNPWVWSLYRAIDADGDGRIDPAEYAAWIAAIGLTDTDTASAFRGFDKNQDGFLSREEFALANQQFWLSPDASTPGHRLIGP
jgi:Ca2+-binding EF-hand superfamily protein